MEENLTRPTCGSDESEPLLLSIVIPAFQAADDLKRCLPRLIRHIHVPCEILVIDDGSTDRTAEIPELFGVRCIRMPRRGGPASARNLGAREANGEWILFVDADVLLHPESVRKAFTHIRQDPSIIALFGSYDDRPEAPSLVSQFRNLLHHHVHQSGSFVCDRRTASTFWTGCGLIRRDVFLNFGGFDHATYERPAIEDIELGYRLNEAGYRIVLARDVLCTHLKPWTLKTMVRTDFFQRGLPWSLLMLRRNDRTEDLNVDRRQKLAAISAGSSLAAFGTIPFEPAFAAFMLACSALTVVSINRSFLGLLRRTGGIRLSMAGVPLLFVYYYVCLTSYATALAIHKFGILKPKSVSSAPAAEVVHAKLPPAKPHFASRQTRDRSAEESHRL